MTLKKLEFTPESGSVDTYVRGTMIAMTMTLSSFVLAAFGLMTTAQSTRVAVSLIT